MTFVLHNAKWHDRTDVMSAVKSATARTACAKTLHYLDENPPPTRETLSSEDLEAHDYCAECEKAGSPPVINHGVNPTEKAKALTGMDVVKALEARVGELERICRELVAQNREVVQRQAAYEALSEAEALGSELSKVKVHGD